MKILQVIHGFPPYNLGGSEVYTYNLCRTLSERHQVFVFHRLNNLSIQEYNLGHRESDNISIFTVNNTFRKYSSFMNTYKNDEVAQRFGAVLDRIQPDVVHIQHLLYLGARLVEEIKKRNIPIVFTLHDYWLMCPQGQLFKDNRIVCTERKSDECARCILYQLSIKNNIFPIYYLLKKIMPAGILQALQKVYLDFHKLFLSNGNMQKLIEERIIYMCDICSKIDVFIAPSKFIKNQFIEFGIPKDKVVYIANGLNLDYVRNSEKNPSFKLKFGYIGNLLPSKGVHVLIQSLKEIKNNNWELRIYGKMGSYKGILADYLKYIKKIASKNNVKFLGGFDMQRIPDIFNEIDVLIVPSLWLENSPLVIQEAFANNTPVIAARIGGIPEMIEDGVNGLLFKAQDIQDLKNKIEYVFDNPQVLNRFRENTPRLKDIGRHAEEIESIYNELVKAN